jgi:hypothetical protein
MAKYAMICGKTKKNMYGLYDSNCRFILQKLHFMQKYALKNAKYANMQQYVEK